MEDDYIQFDHANKEAIEENRERIERLFCVRLGITDNGDGKSSCQIICQSNHAPEVLVKTKNYINALTGEGTGFSITTERYNLHQVNMILHQKDDIEQQSATVLLASPFSNNVRLQGQLQDILLAKNIIGSLLNQEQINVTKTESNNKPKLRRKASSKQAEAIAENSAIGKGESESEGNIRQAMPESDEVPQTETMVLGQQDSWKTEKYFQEHLMNLGVQTPMAQLKLESDTDSSDSDDDEVYEEIKTNSDYKNKVGFALKLGYQEADLLQALRKIGNHASQDELLSELVKQGASKSDDSGSDGSLVLTPNNETYMLDFGIQQRKSNLDKSSNLRHIIIDGSNVAMSHGNKEVFSCMGIKLAVDWFRNRCHTDITVFVPQWRKETSRSDARIKDQAILNQLEKDKILVFTPARRIGGKRVVCYDDRYILKLAVETDGIVVSNDNYRDLIGEKEEFKKVIEERLLMYSFVNDRFMPPDDPLGRSGPTLDNFLLIQPSEPEPLPPPCPYGSKKCTYGNKCKYYHPERKNQPHKTVTEKLAEQARQRMQDMEKRSSQQQPDGGKKKLSRKTSLQRTTSLTSNMIDSQSLLGNIQDHISGSVSNLDTSDEKYVEYNQKLRESLLKMEQEQARKDAQSFKDIQTQSPDRNVELRSRGSDYSERQSSPRWTCIPGIGSSREASPVNLAVPGQGTSLESGEQFISGHLLLAKKLSDEANESDKLKKKEKRRDSGAGSPSSLQQFQRSSVNKQSADAKKSKPKQPVLKQKLSRQLSLQGGEDPRLRQGHSSLRAQYSYDPRLAANQAPFFSPDNTSENSLLRDFMNSQSFDGQREFSNTSLPCQTSQGKFGVIGQGLPSQKSHAMSRPHTSLSRMQSAPHPSNTYQQHQRPVPTMMRQNSSSDTQLNKIDVSSEAGYVGEKIVHGNHGDMLIARGSLPQKDKSGSLTFQIGGAPPARHPLQHYNSMGSLNQGFQQFGQNDQDYIFHHHQQQPQYLSQTYSDIPQSRMPFMQSNHGNLMTQPAPPNYGNLRASPSFMISQPIHDPSQLIDQTGIWQTNQYETETITPARSGSSISTSSMPAQHFSPRSQSNSHPLVQQQFSVPIPEDRPIMADDPRYKLYFHLCGLFPEEKVRVVMNQHPETTNASEICSYIISTG